MGAAHTLSALLRIMGPVQSASVTVTNKVVLNNGQPFFKTWLANLMCERGPVQMHMSYGRDFGVGEFTSFTSPVFGLRRPTIFAPCTVNQRVPF